MLSIEDTGSSSGIVNRIHRRTMVGYLHPKYAKSFGEIGSPCFLPQCGGWIIKRKIPGSPYCDAMGCYPLFLCQDWTGLIADIENLQEKLVSFSIVTDPFGQYNETYLHECFRDVVSLFKEHYIIDLKSPLDTFVSDHHCRNSKRALKDVHVERCKDPYHYLNDWMNLYANLIDRYTIRGIPRFSQYVFDIQLKIPGIVMFRAEVDEAVVGMILWYIHDQVGYYHLGAYNDLGYRYRASFALFWTSLEYFASLGLDRLDLGASAGIQNDSANGLSRFKAGWSTRTLPAYFCGRIFDREKYITLSKAKFLSGSTYFPLYREGEFRSE